MNGTRADERSDAELLGAVADGDGDAMRVLNERHAPWLVLRLSRRCGDPALVDEVVQDTFLAVWRRPRAWHGLGEVAAWLWDIAVRRLLDRLRRRPVPLLGLLAERAGRAEPSAEDQVLFLLLAPLLPVAGVAAAYGPGIDPTHELATAAPMHGFRLLLRAAAVLASTTLLAATAALALPDLGWLAAAWLLPALGLTLASLALATLLGPAAAAGTVALAWVAAVGATQWAAARHLRDPLVAPVSSVLFDPAGQLAFLALAALAVLLLARRSDRFDLEPSRRQP